MSHSMQPGGYRSAETMVATWRSIASVLMLVVLAGGCATIREDQCAKTDWHELGMKDGRAGYAADRLVDHRKACARVQVEPDELRYLQGRKAGIAEYCQPDNAFRDGLAGHEYHGVCDAVFARNHRAAYNVAMIRKDLETNRSAVSWREAEVRGDKASEARKNNLRSEIRDLDRQREALRERLAIAERELDRVRALSHAPVAPMVAATIPPPPSPPPAVAAQAGSPGAAMGGLRIGSIEAPLHFAYTFVAPDRSDNLRIRPMLLLAEHAIPANRLGQAADLDRLLAELPYYVLAIRNESKPPKITMIVRHPQLGPSAVIEKDAGKSGQARFDEYGSERIAGRLASPQAGKNPYAWNKAIRLDVKFDAPLVRRWP
jgi:Protein of unknown function (DUF2799)